jgi:hypothetical protein
MRFMRLPIAVLRLAASVAGATAIVVTLEDSVAQGAFDASRFFGFFTIQGNVIAAVVLLVAAIHAFTHRAQGAAFVWVRGAMTTYIAVVGIVYNTLLIGQDGGVIVPWVNTVLHTVIPLYAVLDWVFVGDRGPLPWRSVWLVLVYPLVWTGATLLRQLVEPHPFIPYSFLDVGKLGAGVVLYVVGIAATFVAVALLAWWASRRRVLRY